MQPLSPKARLYAASALRWVRQPGNGQLPVQRRLLLQALYNAPRTAQYKRAALAYLLARHYQ